MKTRKAVLVTAVMLMAVVSSIDCESLTSVTFEGIITSDNFGGAYGDAFFSPFDGDLSGKYLAGGIGTYTRANGASETWEKQ